MKEMLIDGVPTSHLGFRAESRPSGIVATPHYIESGQVIGRDGQMYKFEGTFDDVVMTIKFSFVAQDEMTWHDEFRRIKRFLLKGGLRRYEYEDNPHYFQIIKKIKIDTPERELLRTGVFECEFVFDPYEYRNDGQIEHPIDECLFNAYSKCLPLYNIIGNGACTLTVNGHEMTFTVSDYAHIDVVHGLAYRNNDQNIVTKGCSITDLVLEEDMNDIQISQGFELKIIPNWRSI